MEFRDGYISDVQSYIAVYMKQTMFIVYYDSSRNVEIGLPLMVLDLRRYLYGI